MALLTSQIFLVAACPLDIVDFAEETIFVSNVSWIELRMVVSSDVSSTTSRLVAQFDLPEVATDNKPPKYKFYPSETMWDGQLEHVGNILPFIANPLHALQVLSIEFGGVKKAYLIIVNALFQRILSFGNPATFPLRFNWEGWAMWTSLWDQGLGAESVNFTLNTKSTLLTIVAVSCQCVVAGSAPSLTRTIVTVMKFSSSITTCISLALKAIASIP